MNKKLLKCVIGVGVFIVAIAMFIRFGIHGNPGRTSIKTSSLLVDAIDISELSTAEFKYRGIADIVDENDNDIRCRACYNAVVKAGIDMSNVQFDVDDENKVVYASLPDIELKVTIIDEQLIELLPYDADVELEILLKSCMADAEKEAIESTELMNTARENLMATIEALTYPILNARNYSLTWL